MSPEIEPTIQETIPKGKLELMQEVVLHMLGKDGSLDTTDTKEFSLLFQQNLDMLAPYALQILTERFVDETGKIEIPDWVPQMYTELSESVNKFDGNRETPLDAPYE